MNIGIDGNEANTKTRVGSGQYSFHILKELNKINKTHRFTVYLKNKPLGDMPKKNKLWQYKVIGPKLLWTKFALPLSLAISKKNVDLFYSPTHYSPNPSPIPTIPTIHDIGYLKTPNQFNKKDFYQLKNWTRDSIKKAKHIVAVSEFTKSEIIKEYKINPQKISVIPDGITKFKKHSSAKCKKILAKFKITKPFFLSVGTLKPNKNYPFLIKAFAKLSGYQLVISGKKGWLFDEIFKVVSDLKLQDKVIFTDFVTEIEKNILFQTATATVLPSLYEGFGIPAIESQSFGTPVIVSDIPSYREIMANSAVYVNPHDQNSLVKAMKNIKKSTSDNYKRYLWHNSAKKLLNLFNTLSNV
ncbi:MAG: glycosyltransferase family 1 protein [Candidatus Shapirobacteria bacterium]